MALLIINMSNMIMRYDMNYFDDIAFINGEEIPECLAVIDTRFDDMYNLQFLLSGKMYLGIDGGERIVLDRPSIFWHHPRHSYQYGPSAPSKSWHHHWVTFRGSRGRRLMEKGFMKLSSRGYVPVARPDEYAFAFRRLITLLKEHDRRRHPEMVIILEQLLSLLASGANESNDDQVHGGKMDRLASEIRSKPFVEYDFKRIAGSMGLSYSHFRRLFRGRMRLAPHNFLLNCRMHSAAKSLAEPLRQVKDVALESGFKDPAQFSKLFRKQIGLSPTSYRKTMF
jgi:AraC-like DNA-binding protein